MATDNDPVDYEYISWRLTRETVQQHEAARPLRRTSAGLNLRVVELRRQEVPVDFDSRFDLANRATTAVKGLTGTLSAPGPYIRDTIGLHFMKVQVYIGFENTGQQMIAGYFSDLSLPDNSRVFIALFGSITNVRGWRATDKLEADVHPSDAAGLYEILDSTMESQDAPIIERYIKDGHGLDVIARLDAAHSIAFRHNQPLRYSGEFEFLAVSHDLVFDVTLNGQHYDVALLGAPIWIRSPKPIPLMIEGLRSC
jgi:hypothetical protein